MTFHEELNAAKPATHKDWQGIEQPIQWPEGKILARCGAVYLFQTDKHRFSVIYGLQVTGPLSRTGAAEEFGQCCYHQSQCEGLSDRFSHD